MFELYTEGARRVIFFSRYEASQLGGRTIETAHLLLGLVRDNRSLVGQLTTADWPSLGRICEELRTRISTGERLPPSIDLPLSEECKRILHYAREESTRLNHGNVGPEHLLLGMLRETNCLAAETLRAHGLDLETARTKIALAPPPHRELIPMMPEAGYVPDPETAMRIAEAVWIPIYGEELVKQQRPLQTDLTASIWTVTGCPSTQDVQALIAAISRIDGRILRINTASPAGQKPTAQ